MLAKTYGANLIEATWRERWEHSSSFQISGLGKAYCIMLPPPNVTGSLHMGHGFQVTLMDALIRYQRMCGKNVLWQGGTDHAGIATQMVVESQLFAQGKTRHDLGREGFIQAVWQWKEASGNRIAQQLRSMGASIDWSRERFTCDPGFSHAVKKAFVDLFQAGLIYRRKRLVNWDPQLLTALSDLEVYSQEEQGYLWTLRYPLDGGAGFLPVATTRPETLFGDVALAVHPEDPRFRELIGQHVKLPLSDRIIPVIVDDHVDPNFGSGCVKITPAHDFDDYALAQRHHLPDITIFTPQACLNATVPAAYQGLDRFVAREKVIADLTLLGLVEKTEVHVLKVPRGDRSGAVIEPYLTDQWFMAMQSLAKPAIAAIQDKQLSFMPETWGKICLQWLENIEDWCISRQLWWGHRIPAWYDKQGRVYVDYDEETIRRRYSLPSEVQLVQDDDVLDTWFSSALWPFVTLGWPEASHEFKTFYPSDVLITGFDIIFFWVARMLMFGLYFTGQVPFKQVYVTGLIRDHDGQKMSKSKGNVLDPVDVIQGISLDALLSKRCQGLMQQQMAEKIAYVTRHQFPKGIPAFGADALRFTYCALASPSRDIHFDLNRTAGYRNFCNKLWNAARFILMQPLVQEKKLGGTALTLPVNRAFRSLLQTTIATMHKHFQDYRFDLMAQAIYEFIWNEYCDWYLEIAKPILLNVDDSCQQYETLQNLTEILEICLRLLHPLMPFITEEIWQFIAPRVHKGDGMLMLQAYPKTQLSEQNIVAEQALAWVKQMVSTVRTLRSEMGIVPAKRIQLLLCKGTDQDRENSLVFQAVISNLAKLTAIHWVDSREQLGPVTMALMGTLEILIPTQGLLDTGAEIQRMEQKMNVLEKEIERAQGKLANEAFIKNAPEGIVEQERQRLVDFTAQYHELDERRRHLKKH